MAIGLRVGIIPASITTSVSELKISGTSILSAQIMVKLFHWIAHSIRGELLILWQVNHPIDPAPIRFSAKLKAIIHK